jgi:hypothetical protein
MDQRPYPGPPILFHIRMTSLFTILWFIDLFMFAFAVDSTTKNGVGGMMMFANEVGMHNPTTNSLPISPTVRYPHGWCHECHR